MKIGIDSYCYHRFFGEVYDDQEAPKKNMTMEDFLRRAKELDVDGVSLESCFFPSFDEAYLADLKGQLDEYGFDRVFAWGHPDLSLIHIYEGDTIALDTGTTTFELAKLLVTYENLTVVTNDLQIAAFLERNGKANIIMAGGAVRRNFHCTAGQKAIDTLSDLNVDKTFLAANGVSAKRGISTPNIDTAHVKEKLVSLGRCV